ncbi:hypothetical protein PF002_g26117 [Phytophthora fragariae]|uniref:Uncharacterized protein n=1 Tax=Phytophthora fragariae TaxID=53985 RepID=A0A6A3WPE2_9STRA|nr:hypothetical protein PF002_g26117 [Phytophthora fragariae]
MQRQCSAWVDAFAFGPLPMEGRYADPSDTPDDSGGISSARAVVADSPRARRRRDAGRVPCARVTKRVSQENQRKDRFS